MSTTEKPYGHTAVVRVRKPGQGMLGVDTEEKTIRRVGSRKKIKKAARLLPRFVEIVKIEAYTEEEWGRAIGFDHRRRY